MKKFLRNLTLHSNEIAEEAILDRSMLGKFNMDYNLTVGDETLLYGYYRYPRTLDLRSI